MLYKKMEVEEGNGMTHGIYDLSGGVWKAETLTRRSGARNDTSPTV